MNILNKHNLLLSLLMAVFIYSAGEGFAQTSCAFALDEAQNSYEEGVFQDIPDLLLPCIERGFSKDERLRAYKLLILTYLFDDKQDRAEEVMREFLDKYPEYEITAADPIEFKHLFEDYETVPLYSFGLILGGNLTDAMITEPYGVGNINEYNGNYKPSGMGIQAGLRVNRFLKERIEINAEVIFTQHRYDFTSSEFDFIEVNKQETFSSLSVPLTGTYDFSVLSLNPYLRAGFSFDYLFNSSAQFRRSYTENTGLTDVTGPELEITSNRKDFYFSFLVGGGIKYNISNAYLMLDLRTNVGLLNFINDENRYSLQSEDSNYRYWYIDDDILLNRLYFTVGYVRKLYKTYKK